MLCFHTAHIAVHTINCTVHNYPFYTAHLMHQAPTLHNNALHTAYCTLFTKDYMLTTKQTAPCTMHTTTIKLNTLCRLHASHTKLHASHSTHQSLHTVHCTHLTAENAVGGHPAVSCSETAGDPSWETVQQLHCTGLNWTLNSTLICTLNSPVH